MRYEFDIPEGGDGLYTIVARFKQDISDGVFTSRQIKIDGEIPYAEAMRARYPYSNTWQVNRANVGDTDSEVLEFYLEAGHHTVEFMATLGEFGSQLSKVRAIATELNDDYLVYTIVSRPTPATTASPASCRKSSQASRETPKRFATSSTISRKRRGSPPPTLTSRR